MSAHSWSRRHGSGIKIQALVVVAVNGGTVGERGEERRGDGGMYRRPEAEEEEEGARKEARSCRVRACVRGDV